MKQPNSVNQPDELDPLPYSVDKSINGWELIAADETEVFENGAAFENTALFVARACNSYAKLIRAVEILIADASVETAAVLAAMDILKEVNSL